MGIVDPRPEGPESQRAWRQGLLLIAMLAVALRFGGLDRHSFWYDEAVTAQILNAPYAAILRGDQRDNGNPPLYFAAARFWAGTFGTSEAGLRSLSAVCGVGLVLATAALGRRIAGTRPGLYAGGLAAVSPLLLELSNEARAYALFHLLAVLATLQFLRWLDGERPLDLALYAALLALSYYAHYYAFLIPFGHGLALLPSASRRRLAGKWLLAGTASLLLWSPWLPAFLAQLATPSNRSRMGETWVLQFAATPLTFAFGRSLVWREAGLTVLVMASLGAWVALWLPALRGWWQLRQKGVVSVLLVGGALLPVVLPLLMAVGGFPLYATRYGAVGLPYLLCLAGVGFASLGPSLRAASASVGLVLTAASLWNYMTRPLKDDWRSAVPLVVSRATRGDVLVFDTDIEVVSFSYYASRLGASELRSFGLVEGIGAHGEMNGVLFIGATKVDTGVRDRAAQIVEGSTVWLLLCLPNSPREAYDRLFESRGFVAIEERPFHRIRVVRYDARRS